MTCGDIFLKMAPTNQSERWTLSEDFKASIDAEVSTEHWKRIGLDLSRQESGNICITVPSGFKTDLGSIPRPLWWFCSPAEIAHAAVVHDAMYARLHESQNKNTLLRKEADDTFYVLLGMQCIAGYRRFFIWLAVRTFGWLYV